MKFPPIIEYDAVMIKLGEYFKHTDDKEFKHAVLSHFDNYYKETKHDLTYSEFSDILANIGRQFN